MAIAKQLLNAFVITSCVVCFTFLMCVIVAGIVLPADGWMSLAPHHVAGSIQSR